MGSILTIMAHPFHDTKTPYRRTLLALRPWLLDSLLSLRLVQNAWRSIAPAGQMATLRDTLSLLSWGKENLNSIAHRKAYTVLALQCVDFAQQSEQVYTGGEIETGDRRILSKSLLHLAQAAAQDRNISRIVAAKIVFSLENLILGSLMSDSTSDLLVY